MGGNPANWRFVDTQKPVREDFSIPTDGAESPWGGAQLTFIARRSQTPDGPTTPQALLAFAARASRQRHLPAAAGFYRYRVS